MKTVICFLIVTTTAGLMISAKPAERTEEIDDLHRFMYVENEIGEFELVDLTQMPVTTKATLADVTYYLYTRSNKNNPHKITNGDVGQLKGSPFNPSRKNLFITHGWNNNYQSSVNTLITEAALANYDLNVFVVDWKKPASSNYVTARNTVTVVGQFQGQFINQIQAAYKLNGASFVLVGHSLGAHVAGNAGAVIRSKVDHIVGLDPALPLFTMSNTGNRLDPSDANFVQIIHTNGGKLGFSDPIGDCDYFPNGGKKQPGCEADLTGTCSHARSYRYFAESLSSNYKYSAHQCSSYKDFEGGKCAGQRVSLMGQFNADRVHGQFFLDTNKKAPFARG